MRGHWLWNRGLRHLLHTCIGGWRKFHAEPVCFLLFFCIQKKFVKALLTYTNISLLLKSFNLSSHGSELRKRYTIRLLLMCAEEGVLEVNLSEGEMTCLGEYNRIQSFYSFKTFTLFCRLVFLSFWLVFLLPSENNDNE